MLKSLHGRASDRPARRAEQRDAAEHVLKVGTFCHADFHSATKSIAWLQNAENRIERSVAPVTIRSMIYGSDDWWRQKIARNRATLSRAVRTLCFKAGLDGESADQPEIPPRDNRPYWPPPSNPNVILLPIRRGHPPGRRRRPDQPIDEILSECHALAWQARR